TYLARLMPRPRTPLHWSCPSWTQGRQGQGHRTRRAAAPELGVQPTSPQANDPPPANAKSRIQEVVPMKTHPSAFLPCLALAGVLLAAPVALADTKPEDNQRPWTILLYGAVDNSADDPFVAFTDQLRRAIDDDPGIELVLFIDRSTKHAKRATFLG